MKRSKLYNLVQQVRTLITGGGSSLVWLPSSEENQRRFHWIHSGKPRRHKARQNTYPVVKPVIATPADIAFARKAAGFLGIANIRKFATVNSRGRPFKGCKPKYLRGEHGEIVRDVTGRCVRV